MKSKTKVIKSPKQATKELEKLAKSLRGPDLVRLVYLKDLTIILTGHQL